MSLTKAQCRACLPWAVFFVIVIFQAWDLIFMRYVLYHSQKRSLRPDDYNIQVVTVEDYRSLSDPRQSTVHLSDGSVITKAVLWDSTAFRPIQNGTLFAKVTTKGTAHILDQALPMAILVLFFGILGMILTWPRTCKTDQSKRTTESNTI